ncbi:MAG: hypothetical protein C5B59_07095 [Bacteroidetes bacterium]|nr:MAG: hypothetical protein C5B59_07095 [Bacteroidota bacterium]
MQLTSKQIARFWQKVDKTDDCWNWTAAVYSSGYGAVTINSTCYLAHRISWLLKHGKDSEQCVLHTCDNRRCVNPSHLFEGTKGDNNRDAVEKGKHSIPYKNARHVYDTNGRWRAIVQGKHLGYFDTEAQALLEVEKQIGKNHHHRD